MDRKHALIAVGFVIVLLFSLHYYHCHQMREAERRYSILIQNMTRSTADYITEKLKAIECYPPEEYYFEKNDTVCFKCNPDVCFVLKAVERPEGRRYNVVGEYMKTNKIDDKFVLFFFKDFYKLYKEGKMEGCKFTIDRQPPSISTVRLVCEDYESFRKLVDSFCNMIGASPICDSSGCSCSKWNFRWIPTSKIVIYGVRVSRR